MSNLPSLLKSPAQAPSLRNFLSSSVRLNLISAWLVADHEKPIEKMKSAIARCIGTSLEESVDKGRIARAGTLLASSLIHGPGERKSPKVRCIRLVGRMANCDVR